MLIGIISDTHDNSRHILKAIDCFKKEKVELVLHCGDWIMPFTLELFLELNCPIKGVLGNGDPDIQKFIYQKEKIFKGLDLELHERFLDITLDGKRIAVFHGNSKMLKEVILESQLFDLFCVGHTHIPSLEKTGKTLVLNPGSLVGVHLPEKENPLTVGIYDTKSALGKIVELD
jgi:putative phosphoesterase